MSSKDSKNPVVSRGASQVEHDTNPREWMYGAEYWVPENHMFKSGSECLEAHPDAGPACGVVSTTAYDRLAVELAAAEKERDEARADLQRMSSENIKCKEDLKLACEGITAKTEALQAERSSNAVVSDLESKSLGSRDHDAIEGDLEGYRATIKRLEADLEQERERAERLKADADYYWKQYEFRTEERDAARAEVERLKERLIETSSKKILKEHAGLFKKLKDLEDQEK